MALQCTRLLRLIRSTSTICRNKASLSAITTMKQTTNKPAQYKTENNYVYREDPDVFGTLSRPRIQEDEFEDDGDIKEQEYHGTAPLESQKLTTRQYADLIKQYISNKRIKDAIDILEVRMLTVDRVHPENYIYNILIGACAEVGYTKKAFKLFNDMKRRALKPTGDTYTCLFHACANSPWAADGLKHAQHLRKLMIEKGIEPNLTNYNAMIKAFGRCGDLPTAFQIVDEMISKNIKIRVHTFNHLLHACIADKNTGLRHALLVWRKLLKMREKPNLFSFNLMLKCVKDCNLGTKADIEELIYILKDNLALVISKGCENLHKIEALQSNHMNQKNNTLMISRETSTLSENLQTNLTTVDDSINEKCSEDTSLVSSVYATTLTMVDSIKPLVEERKVPNLLSKVVQMQHVLGLQEVHTLQDKFAVIGGQEDFFKEMDVYSVKPDIKIFTQMLPLLNNTTEAEEKLLETLKKHSIVVDIDFYNNLIKKRCLRSDYDAAFDVKDIILKENKRNKKLHPFKKKLQLKFNIMTYGVLALACVTKESAEKLINEMRESQLKINIEILGTLLKNGVVQNEFDYVLYIMKITKEENVKINKVFLKHLDIFNKKVQKKSQLRNQQESSKLLESYKNFARIYNAWMEDINIEEVLKPENPWQQFNEKFPETFQRTDIVIREPRKFYKRRGKFVKYVTKL